MNHKFIKFNNDKLPIQSVIQNLQSERPSIVVDDSFQRKIVWKESKMKQDLIKSLILGMPIGTIIVWETTDEEGIPISKIVDGQQRLRTIQSFLNNEFSLQENTIKIILQNKNISTMIRNYSNRDIYAKNLMDKKENKKFSELPEYFKTNISNHQLNIISIYNISEKEIREYFKVLQNQEKLKAGEILHSMEDDHILKFLNQEDINEFCKWTNFNDIRMGFHKHFTVFMSMIKNDKTRMGMPDDEIIKLADKISIDDYLNDELFLDIIKNIKYDAYHPNNFKNNDNDKSYLGVLGLKLLLWTYLFSNEKFKNYSLSKKTQILKKITKMAGYLNSKDVDKKKPKLFDQFNKYKDYDTDVLYKGVENSWKLNRTTHSKDDISEKFESINYLIYFIAENPDFDYLI